ncbi:MAG: DUF802 domain-containing protein [Burkholderiaceae bacterium]
MNRFFHFLVFAAGLAVACWIGAGYLESNLLALAVTALIIIAYLAGALELLRYKQATSTLTKALADLSAAPGSLDEWLAKLHPSLRVAARQRIEGERVGLPGPTLAPYLVGLLVLLGMLGTFLGMVATLRGTGLALEGATDLQAIRASLAAPVKGLGFAFGTSVAGVAASAMLGLLSALCRRERVQATQKLDARIAAELRPYSPAHQREESAKLLQRQTEGMAQTAEKLQAMMAAMERRDASLNEALAARQSDFHAKADAAYMRLAGSVEGALKESVAEGARQAAEAVRPVAEATMADLARNAASLQGAVEQALRQQLDGWSSRLEASSATVADIWKSALAEHQRASDSLIADLRASLDGSSQAFEQRSSGLLDAISARMEAASDAMSEAWKTALSRQELAGDKLADSNQRALTAAVSALEQHAASMVHAVDQSHAELRSQSAAQDEQRLAAWRAALDDMAAALGRQWQTAGEQAADRQQQICDTLEQTAGRISAQAREQADGTIAQVEQLMHAAAEAPKAAAGLVAEVRQAFSDSMARDNATLEERNRLMETLATLLEAVNHASSEQRGAVDALLARSADTLDRIGVQFTDAVQAETGKIGQAAAQLTGSAVEVASLGEAFGSAVQSFGQSNSALMEHLQRIEAVLDKSLARSDEQLAYYVAQAKEVVDLSILSQKQIIEELQQMTNRQTSAGQASA